ncbi:MAG TPA: MarR family transcriptional regulator [Gaiellaceae bacterium]|nr:MarR family transcriptional regulator [Gaiellaceae bacterium]
MAPETGAHLDARLDELLDVSLARGQALAHVLLSRPISTAAYRRVTGGIPPVQLQALVVLAAGDMRMRELARRLGLATSTVTRLVDRLEAAGLAERRKERPDRRSVLVGLSSTGRDALGSVRKRLGGLLRELIGGLSPHEQGELLRLLTKVGEGLVPPALEPAPAPVRAR